MQPPSQSNPVSEDEDDGDYVPDVNEPDYDAEHASRAKRARKDDSLEVNTPVMSEENKKQASAELWAEFQASVSSSSLVPGPKSAASRMVKIEKRYRFAGEDVVEVKEVLENSEDARNWPRWVHPQVQANERPGSPAASADSSQASSAAPAAPDNLTRSGATCSESAPPPESASSISKPAPKRPGPRKSKVTLGEIPKGPQKAKKLSTLDRSAMEWQSYVSSGQDEGVQDALATNRRGGGYLEKVEFLQRVDDRKNEALESAKGSKRRRG